MNDTEMTSRGDSRVPEKESGTQPETEAGVSRVTDSLQDPEEILNAKRGRGRPRSRLPEESQSVEVPAGGTETAEPESKEDGKSGSQHFILTDRTAQLLAEIVRTQNQSQADFIRAQSEFSNSVMDRMDSYRILLTRLQNEVAEKDKSRMRADLMAAQDQADEYQKEISRLKAKIDEADRTILELSIRSEKLRAEAETFQKSLKELRKEKQEREMLRDRKMCQAARTFTVDTEDMEPRCRVREGWFTRRRRRKYLQKVYESDAFTDEQKEVIREADQSEIPFERLTLICSPDIPPENMKMMALYLQR